MKVSETIFLCGFIQQIETNDAFKSLAIIEAVKTGGIKVIELMWNRDTTCDVLNRIKNEYPDLTIGVGNLHSLEECTKAIESGAQFILIDKIDKEILEFCQKHDVLMIPQCDSIADVIAAKKENLVVANYVCQEKYDNLFYLRQLAASFTDMKFIVSLGAESENISSFLCAPFVNAVCGSWTYSREDIENENWNKIIIKCEDTITSVMGFEMYHLGINMESAVQACHLCDEMHEAFRFKLRDNGPSSRFAGNNVEVMKKIYRGEKGHFAIRTNNVDRAIAYLMERGYQMDMDTAYYADGRIYTVYLKDEYSFGGFAVHLLQKTF